MKTRKILLAMMAVCAGAFAGCGDDKPTNPPIDPPIDPPTEGFKYVVAATGTEAVYLLAADQLSSGNVTVMNNAVEAETATVWLFNRNKYAYRLVYNQGNAGTGGSYILDANGNVKKRSIEFASTRFTSYGNYGKYIITAAAAASTATDAAGNAKYGIEFTMFDTDNQTKDELLIDCEDMTGNGEYYTLAGIVEVDGKIYSGLVPVGMSAWGTANNPDKIIHDDLVTVNAETGAETISGTQYPNEAYVIIFDDMTFNNYTILKSDKISYPTARFRSQYYSTVAAAEDGYVYVFSASDAKTSSKESQVTNLASGGIRINTATSQIDDTFHVDLEAKSGGRRMHRVWHITGTEDYFLLRMYDVTDPTLPANNEAVNPNMLAIFKASTGAFTWVTDIPEITNIGSASNFPYFEDGKAYLPIVTLDNQQPAIYVIDPVTAKGTKGLSVESTEVTAAGKLTY